MSGFIKQFNYYMEFYKNLVVSSWDNITYWQYMGLSVAVLAVGYLWMSKGAEGNV